MPEPYISAFTNKATSEIPYPASLAALYGPYPKVEVLYWDEEASEYYLSGSFTRVSFSQSVKTGNRINIDHGGSNSGVVKIS